MSGKEGFCALGLVLTALLAAGWLAPATHAQDSAQRGCVTTPRSPLVVNVKDKGARATGEPTTPTRFRPLDDGLEAQCSAGRHLHGRRGREEAPPYPQKRHDAE